MAKAVIVCEGASEVGFLRGFDRVNVALGEPSLTALGVALVDAGGCDHIYRRADAFQLLKYRVCAFRDDDKQPDEATEKAFVDGGGSLFKWRKGRALEDELFLSLTDNAVFKLIERAEELHGTELIDAHISSESLGTLTLADCKAGFSQVRNRRCSLNNAASYPSHLAARASRHRPKSSPRRLKQGISRR